MHAKNGTIRHFLGIQALIVPLVRQKQAAACFFCVSASF
jgi:hypothetical protein